MCWPSVLHKANNAYGRTGSNLGMDEFYFILVHGSKMLYLAFKSLTYEQILNQMTCRDDSCFNREEEIIKCETSGSFIRRSDLLGQL